MNDPCNKKDCNDPQCGCKEPAFTQPLEALVFLSQRFKHAGVADGVALTYARDIDAMLAKLDPTKFAAHTEILEAGPVCISGNHDAVDQAVKLVRAAGGGYRKGTYSGGPVSDGGMDPRDRDKPRSRAVPTWQPGDRVLWESSEGKWYPGTIRGSHPSMFAEGTTDYDCALDNGDDACGYSGRRFRALDKT